MDITYGLLAWLAVIGFDLALCRAAALCEDDDDEAAVVGDEGLGAVALSPR